MPDHTGLIGQRQMIGGQTQPPTANARQPQLLEQLTQMHESLETLQRQVNSLETRLSGVLRPSTPSPTPAGVQRAPDNPPALVPFAAALAEHRARVESTIAWLADLEARLEV